jgi:hypothetical protein
MFRLFRSAAAAIALVAAVPAWAQIYKWVDEKGVVNYSSRPPAGRKSTVLDPNSVSVSTYTPDESLTQASRAKPSATERALAERVASLERRLEAERYSRQLLADAQTRAMDARFEQCLRDRRVDCEYAGFEPYYAPYWTTVVVSPRHHRHFRPQGPVRPKAGPAPPRPAYAPIRAPRPAVPTI